MNSKNIWLVSGLLCALSVPAWAEPVTVSVTAQRSSLTFISDAPGERIVGTATGLSGSVQTDLANPAATTGTIQFPVENMETGNAMRDQHMRGDQWLNAAAHPNIVFTIERIDGAQVSTDGNRTDITGTAVGTVLVNGVSAPAQAQVSVAVNSETQTVRIQPTFSVTLANHNVAGRDGAIGDTVGATIAIEGTVYGTIE